MATNYNQNANKLRASNFWYAKENANSKTYDASLRPSASVCSNPGSGEKVTHLCHFGKGCMLRLL